MNDLEEKFIKILAYNTEIQTSVVPNIALMCAEVAEEHKDVGIKNFLEWYVSKSEGLFQSPEFVLNIYKQHLKDK